MTCPTPPANLPCIQVEGYQITYTPSFVETDLGDRAGVIYRRSRTKQQPLEITCQWLMTEAELADFEYWYENDLNHGVKWWQCSVAVPHGVSTHNVRFRDWSAAKLAVDLWRVSASMTVRERDIMTKAEVDAELV